MAASNVGSLLQQHGLQVDSITSQPLEDLYNHCTLDHPNDIRLIGLFPPVSQLNVDGEQPLVAQMLSGPLDVLKTQYEALSYVWGSGEKPKHITVVFLAPDDRALVFDCSITENLWQALYDLRMSNAPRVLWIDALCINQDDVPEKNVQVSQMREVYAGAKRTVAYLGQPFDGLEALVAYRDCHETKTGWVGRPPAPGGQFMRFLPEQGIVRVNQTPHRIIASLIGMVLPYFYLRYGIAIITSRSFAQRLATALTVLNVGFTLKLLLSQNKFLPRKEPEVLFSPDQLVYGLAEFFVRPWFRRAWIIQECVVSPTFCFLVGREEFDVDDMSRMVWDRKELKTLLAGFVPVSTHLLGFQKMLNMRRARSEGRPAPSLSTLLMWTWSYGVGEEATNPRDNIFALLGLVDGGNPEYFVDYTPEPHEVFWRYGKILSQTAERFMLLEDPRHHDGSNMPSWVPDFSKRTDHSLHGLNDFYSSSEGLPSTPYQLSSNGASLEVSAILLAGIDFIGRQYAPMPSGLQEFHRMYLANVDNDPFQKFQGPAPNLAQWMNINKGYLELRDDIDDLVRGNSEVRLPEGLEIEAATEVLTQVGIFFDQKEGFFAAPNSSRLFQVEKYLDSNDTQELINKTVTAVRYFRLHMKGLIFLDTLESRENLATETDSFFSASAEQPSHDRSRLFQKIMEQPDTYPFMSQHPLFRALSQEEWPPESMKNDKSIPTDIYNDDKKLFYHFTISCSTLAGLGPWAERRLAKTPEGYLCNVDCDSQLDDQIAVVSGCRMPLILRPKEDGTYGVIGHAYVMGLMYGEAMKLGIETRRILLS